MHTTGQRARQGRDSGPQYSSRAGGPPAGGPASSAGDSRRPVAGGSRRTSLVSDQNNCSQEGDVCPALPARLIRMATVDDQGDKRIMPMRCKKWSCPGCQGWLRRRLRRAFVAAVEERPQLRRFYTLTLPGEARRLDLADRYRLMSKAWASYRLLHYKRHGRQLAYALVREPHKDGTPHVHGLTDRFVDVRQLSEDWARCGGGYVDIRYVDPHRAAAYVSKYLAKPGPAPPTGIRKYASGGGVKLRDVRPAGGDGTWWIEAHAQLPGGRTAWLWEPDPRALFGQLAARAGLESGPPDVVDLARARAYGVRRQRPTQLSKWT